MFLSDKDIVEAIERKELAIEPFNNEQMTPNGYDLKVVPVDPNELEGARLENGQLILAPGGFVKLKTEETVSLANDYIGFMWLRSKYSRNGLFASTAVIDSGFRGKLYLSIKNLSNSEIAVDLSKGVVHLVFAKLISESLVHVIT
jgi:deoxycytidine triphosphate deaminase